MPEYMLLIYDDEQQWAAMSPEEQGRIMQDYFAYTNHLRERGVYIRGDALLPTTTATAVRVRDGDTLTTDGPFAETKEQLGGYYLIDAKDLDEAIELAAMIPSARLGQIEIRPVMPVADEAKGHTDSRVPAAES
jgi:hypothetical protein